MPRARWNGAVLAAADADEVRIVEGHVYFPPESVDHSHLRESRTQTVCPLRGIASYYDVVVEGEVNQDAAWFYAAPKPAAEEIAGCIAFGRSVAIDEET